LLGASRQLVSGPGGPVGPHADVPALHALDRADATAAALVEQVNELAGPRGSWTSEEAAREPGAAVVVEQLEISAQDELAFDAWDNRAFR
jgi:hypothetical protein